jgi:hypothetical protein
MHKVGYMAKQLLFSLTKKDFIIQPYRGSGNGGQNRNKVESCIRIIHSESGAMVECCDERDQIRNKRIAFERLVNTPKFQQWHKLKTAAVLLGYQKTEDMINANVEKAMQPENIKVEYRDEDGKWAEEPYTGNYAQ